MNDKLIQKQADLKSACKAIKRAELVAIDLEFMRYKTFYPLLCLIQVNVNDEGCFAIDPLAQDIDLKPFAKILKKKSITKVLHSSYQDLEVLYRDLGFVPKSIFDTQLMGNFLDFDFNVSYASLVKQLADAEICKDQQRSDWKQRPLSEEQIVYALNDVEYLPRIYNTLIQRLKDEGKFKFFLKETKAVSKKNYDIDKQDIFKNFAINHKNIEYRSNLRALLEWRDESAKTRDIPRSFVLKDNFLNDIAKKDPRNKRELDEVFSEQNFRSDRIKNKVFSILKGRKLIKKYKKTGFVSSRLSDEQKVLVSKAQNLLKKRASEYKMRPELVINQSDLRSIILQNVKLKTILSGWRYEVFGKDLKNLLC
jgi:ribonuclease D